MKKGIVVESLDEADEAFLAGRPVRPKEVQTLETIVDIPNQWTLPASVDYKIRLGIQILDTFQELEGCEVGFMNVFGNDPTHLQDILLFNQLVRGGTVDYSDESAAEVYRRVDLLDFNLDKTSMRELNLGGITHLHPGGVSGPSSLDLKKFEECTWYNMWHQDLFGWVDATKEFETVVSEKDIRAALKTKDAVLLTEHLDTKAFFKVQYGYSLFLIYGRSDEKPWFGVGECKKYCFDGGPKSYRLLEERDGIHLNIVDDDQSIKATPKEMEDDIRRYVRLLIIPQPKRPSVIPVSVTAMPFVYEHPEIVGSIEDKMPATASEFFSLLGDFSRFEGNSPDALAVRRVHELFSNVYRDGRPYDQQIRDATAVLRQLSPAYDAAMKLKNGESNA